MARQGLTDRVDSLHHALRKAVLVEARADQRRDLGPEGVADLRVNGLVAQDDDFAAGRRNQQQHAVAVPRGVQAQPLERALGQASAAADEAGDRDADLARGPGLGARDGLFHSVRVEPPQNVRRDVITTTPMRRRRPSGRLRRRSLAAASAPAASAAEAATSPVAAASAAAEFDAIVVSSINASLGLVTMNPSTSIPMSPRTRS